MRDPSRIPRILVKLQTAWLANPDWRLGQLVVNASHLRPHPAYHVEDDKIEAGLDELLANPVDDTDAQLWELLAEVQPAPNPRVKAALAHLANVLREER